MPQYTPTQHKKERKKGRKEGRKSRGRDRNIYLKDLCEEELFGRFWVHFTENECKLN
jgi:hypothetical protein